MSLPASSPDRPRAAELLVPITPVLVMLGLMWLGEIIDVPLDGRLDRFGIRPRQLGGLDGILFSPFLHNGFGHLIANTFPFLILGAAIAFGSTRRFLLVTLLVGLISGLGTWLTGPANSLAIGASGLIFGYVTYLLSRGIFARKASWIIGGIVVFLIYGGVLWGVLPGRPGISWQGHLFGAVGGVAAAWLIHRHQPELDQPATA